METVVFASCTPQQEEMLARRQRLGQDRHDEVWRGEYHMVPGPDSRHGRLAVQFLFSIAPAAATAGLEPSTEFNLGEPEDFRVPDLGLRRDAADATYLATAALVVEVVSPGDESWLKFDFYAAHGVDEVVIVDGDTETVHWFVLDGGAYRPVDHSPLLDLDVAAVTAAMTW